MFSSGTGSGPAFQRISVLDGMRAEIEINWIGIQIGIAILILTEKVNSLGLILTEN